GVRHLSPVPGGVNRLFQRGHGDGIRLEVENERVYADIYLVLEPDVNIRRVSREVQKRVARAISEMVGMEVGRVNIHIEDIAYNGESKTPTTASEQ
ncbi:MAG: Asp23/Gls24 family envelope stress response protein, partial [Anaerolineae bacterium]